MTNGSYGFSRWQRWLLTILIAIFASILFWSLVIMVFEEHFIFFPSVFPSGPYEAEERALHPEEHWFFTEDSVKLHAWLLRTERPLATLLFFHGNAGNLAHRGEILRRLHAGGFNVFIFDYRGYGKSEGSPTERGVYLDGQAAYRYLASLEGVDPESIVFFGSSLGGAVAVDVAQHTSPSGIILEGTFSSARDVAASVYPFLPMRFLLRSQFDSESKIRTLNIPLLMFHGTHDTVIPLKLGKKLYDAALPPKEFVEVPGADHNDLFLVGGRPFLEQIKTFCRSLAR